MPCVFTPLFCAQCLLRSERTRPAAAASSTIYEQQQRSQLIHPLTFSLCPLSLSLVSFSPRQTITMCALFFSQYKTHLGSFPRENLISLHVFLPFWNFFRNSTCFFCSFCLIFVIFLTIKYANAAKRLSFWWRSVCCIAPPCPSALALALPDRIWLTLLNIDNVGQVQNDKTNCILLWKGIRNKTEN